MIAIGTIDITFSVLFDPEEISNPNREEHTVMKNIHRIPVSGSFHAKLPE
jgi:hypothetical protein